jgi:hypothetical protein
MTQSFPRAEIATVLVGNRFLAILGSCAPVSGERRDGVRVHCKEAQMGQGIFDESDHALIQGGPCCE